jgi:hypothetical protein
VEDLRALAAQRTHLDAFRAGVAAPGNTGTVELERRRRAPLRGGLGIEAQQRPLPAPLARDRPARP